MPFPEDPSLEDILNNDVMRRAFMDYNANKQLEPEQVPFLLATKQFRDMVDRGASVQDLSTEANRIAGQFVKVNGEGINIGNENSKAVLAEVDKLGKMSRNEIPVGGRGDMEATFEIAENEMRALIRTNGLPRFVQTEQFQAARQEALKVEMAEGRLKQLEAKAEKLQGSRWERFKSHFIDGGPEKLQAKLVAEMDKTKMEILQKTDPEAFEKLQRGKQQMVDKLQRKQDQLAPKVEQYQEVRQAVIKEALDSHGAGAGVMSTKERLENDKLVKKAPQVQAAVDKSNRLGQEKAEVQASVKVGDVLKNKLGQQGAQGQSAPRIKH